MWCGDYVNWPCRIISCGCSRPKRGLRHQLCPNGWNKVQAIIIYAIKMIVLLRFVQWKFCTRGIYYTKCFKTDSINKNISIFGFRSSIFSSAQLGPSSGTLSVPRSTTKTWGPVHVILVTEPVFNFCQDSIDYWHCWYRLHSTTRRTVPARV